MPLVLEGDTLGKRQQHFNKLVNEVIAEVQSATTLEKLNHQDNDIENIFRIDIASNNKYVEYILEVLKSEDILYVSRAIKRCTWLITDQKYAHIINPEYLNSHLFPQMTYKASSKLMLHIRHNLRDESRVEAFYNYYKDKNPIFSIKLIPYCTLSFIEKEIVVQHSAVMRNIALFKCLCNRSIKVLEILCKLEFDTDLNYCKKEMLRATMFLMNTHPEEYLNIVDSIESFFWPYFRAKAVKSIMKKCPQRLTENFGKYKDHIDLETFAKLLKKENIKEFLLKHIENENLRAWFTFDNVKHFVRHLPKEGRYYFVKTFIEKVQKNENNLPDYDIDIWWPEFYTLITNSRSSNSENIYHWYRYAPFDVAFAALKQLMYTEPSPVQRNIMLDVLVSCAGRNKQHTRTLLQYYHDKHMNESFEFKVEFVNAVISKTTTHNYDEKTWEILNNIFCSMYVYTELNNHTQSCIESIIIYKILHNNKVPEILENMINFRTLKLKPDKYNCDDKEKIFNYFLNFIETKVQNKNISNETELKEAVTLLEDLLYLLMDWKRDLGNYPCILNKIKNISNIQKENHWKVDLLPLFNMKKSWRKFMFEESLVMSPSEEACLNALKNDPELLTRHNSEVEALRRNDAVSLRRLLSKLRIYWPQSLASKWAESYLQRLHETSGHKSLTIGLYTLLPQKPLLDIIKKYTPTETKINGRNDDEVVVGLREHIAKNMHLARPLLPLDAVLSYAQSDYLQHVEPSFNTILHNISSASFCENIPKFLNTAQCLQKCFIRLVFTKLNSKELKQTVPDIWKSTSNPTIRTLIFKTTYNLLCQEKSHKVMEELWELLSILIDNVSTEENEEILEIVGKVDTVPIMIRGKYCMKSFDCLKSLPNKAICKTITEKLSKYTRRIMEFLLDEDFVANILLESLETKFTTRIYDLENIMSSYLLCSKNEQSQTLRYEKVLAPVLNHALALWNSTGDERHYVRRNIRNFLRHLCQDFPIYVLQKDMVFPIKMFTDIENLLEENLTAVDFYVVLRHWKLVNTFIKALEPFKALVSTIRQRSTFTNDYYYYSHFSDETWNEVYLKASLDFAEACLQCLKEDIDRYGSSIWVYFVTSFKIMLKNFRLHHNHVVYMEIIKCMLVSKNTFIESYLLAIQVMPEYYFDSRDFVIENRKLIYSHPSMEVKMHYCRRYPQLDLDFEHT